MKNCRHFTIIAFTGVQSLLAAVAYGSLQAPTVHSEIKYSIEGNFGRPNASLVCSRKKPVTSL